MKSGLRFSGLLICASARAELLDEPTARSLLREVKAVGGNLRNRAQSAHGGRARSRALDSPLRPGPHRDPGPARARTRERSILDVRIYDTQTRALAELPAPPGPIRMYFCGPTVYQRIHVGNARPFVLSMWLRRWLKAQGYDVTLVENITDINDKIYDAAPPPKGLPSKELAVRATDWYVEDTEALGLGRPDEEPRVTETLHEIVTLIEELVARDLAYPAAGDMYFRVRGFSDYGCLSGQQPDEVQEQEPNAAKDDPRDFALWKGRKEDEDAAWPSPWGDGRPGWHIECSAMAEKFLGHAFEIHGGGLDPRLPAPRERARTVARRRSRVREDLDAQRHACSSRARRCRSRSATSRRFVMCSRGGGEKTLLLYFMTGLWRKPNRLLGGRAERGPRHRLKGSATPCVLASAQPHQPWPHPPTPRAGKSWPTHSMTTSILLRRSRSFTAGEQPGASICFAAGSSSSGSAHSRRSTKFRLS